MRKLFTFLCAALMSASMFALTPKSGDTWDEGTRTLTVNSDLPNEAYKDQTVIEHVIINNGVTSIGIQAFSGCTAVTSVTIGNSVTSIGTSAFESCSGLTSIVVASENTTYDSRDNCNAIIETATNTLVVGCKNTIIPNSVTSIGYAFSGCTGLTSIEIPNSVTSIGNGAFFNCSGLTSVTIPNGVTSIGVSAFAGCTALTSIEIPNNVTSIGMGAFGNCTGLTSVTNYAVTPQTINSYVFYNVNTSSCTLYVPEGSINLYQAADYWKDFNIQAIAGGDEPTPTVVASGNCGAKVGDEYGTNLTWKYYSDNSLVIEGSGAMADFEFSYATYDIDYPWINYRNQITSVSVGEGITTIGNSAFSQFTNLQSISLPSTLQTIGSTVFYYCEKLPSITIPANVTSIGVSTFSYCELLASANIPVGVTFIPESLFYDCHALQTIVLPEGVQSIGEEAFYSCDGLTNISFPSTLTQIGDYAFNWSTSLASITLPASIESIGEAAFASCPSLTNVTMLGSTPATLGEDAFATISSSLTFTVPTCELIDTYAAAGYDTYVDANYQSSSTSIVSATGDCGGSTPTDEQVPTNADPENPGTYYYSTFFHSTQKYALTNDGTQAFVADLSGSDLLLTKIAEGTDVIPANTAVIFRKAGSDEPVALTPTDAEAVSFTANNDLEGVDVETAVTSIAGLTTDNCYVLSGTNENGVGFYRINSNNLKAHKAYVKYAGSQTNAPKRMRFVFNQEQVVTGMDNANADIKAEKRIENGQLIIIKNGVRYNVQGQIVR